MGKRTELRLKREKQKRNTTLGLLTGLGLILLGVVVLMALPRGNATNSESISTVPAQVNYPAPELALENVAGNTESLDDFRDKVVLVNNWATWCPPCKAEMPTLVAFYNDHSQEGLMIIAIEAGESQDEVQKFVDQFQMPFHVWLDPDGDSATAFNNHNLPNSYVIDRNGAIRLTWTGQINREMLEKYVAPLLAGN